MKRISTIPLLLLFLIGTVSAQTTAIKTFPYFYDWTVVKMPDGWGKNFGDGFWNTTGWNNPPFWYNWQAFTGEGYTKTSTTNGGPYNLWVYVDATERTFSGNEAFTFDIWQNGSVYGTVQVFAGDSLIHSQDVSLLPTTPTPTIAYLPTNLSGTVFKVSIVAYVSCPIPNACRLYVDNTGFSGGALPVGLSSFTIRNAGKNSAELNWTTISEQNNYGFEVQKGPNGRNDWMTLGFVPGHGTTLSAYNYSYSDNSAPFTFYRLKQIDLDGTAHYTEAVSLAVADVAIMNAPTVFTLHQNYPNPFNPSRKITFTTTRGGAVSLRVYDILGREVSALVNENRSPGQYTERFDAGRLASGVYVYVLKSSEGQRSGRMVLSK